MLGWSILFLAVTQMACVMVNSPLLLHAWSIASVWQTVKWRNATSCSQLCSAHCPFYRKQYCSYGNIATWLLLVRPRKRRKCNEPQMTSYRRIRLCRPMNLVAFWPRYICEGGGRKAVETVTSGTTPVDLGISILICLLAPLSSSPTSFLPQS